MNSDNRDDSHDQNEQSDQQAEDDFDKVTQELVESMERLAQDPVLRAKSGKMLV